MIRSLIIIFAILATTLIGGRLALADAMPVQLVLLYMPNVSNTDTPGASGIAELVMPEGEVRIKTADLPRLDAGQRYVAWVVNTQRNVFDRLGSFNTAESTGAVAYETVLPDAIPDEQWNLLLITVEDSASPDQPSSQHSIAGVFPSPDNAALPVVLPNTGGGDDSWYTGGSDWRETAVLGALLSPVTLDAGYPSSFLGDL